MAQARPPLPARKLPCSSPRPHLEQQITQAVGQCPVHAEGASQWHFIQVELFKPCTRLGAADARSVHRAVEPLAAGPRVKLHAYRFPPPSAAHQPRPPSGSRQSGGMGPAILLGAPVVVSPTDSSTNRLGSIQPPGEGMRPTRPLPSTNLHGRRRGRGRRGECPQAARPWARHCHAMQVSGSPPCREPRTTALHGRRGCS